MKLVLSSLVFVPSVMVVFDNYLVFLGLGEDMLATGNQYNDLTLLRLNKAVG